MNIRPFIIVAAIAFPVAALALFTQYHNQADANSSPKRGEMSTAQGDLPATDVGGHKGNETLEEARARLKKRLEVLENMTPEQWEAEQAQKREMAKKQRDMIKDLKEKAAEGQNPHKRNKPATPSPGLEGH